MATIGIDFARNCFDCICSKLFKLRLDIFNEIAFDIVIIHEFLEIRNRKLKKLGKICSYFIARLKPAIVFRFLLNCIIC